MASGTADLQRDLGGAIMQSIFGALLTAGYASAVTGLIAQSPDASQLSDSTQAALTKSFSSAENLASGYPEQTQEAIIAGPQSAFIDGQDWAYLAGLIAVVLGAVLVFLMFPKHRREEELLAEYHRTDTAARAESAPTRR
jgi:MFS transporter, DHA2 family, multidrug resistance protein